MAETNWLGEVFDQFFKSATVEGKTTDIVIGLAGEFSGGYCREHGMMISEVEASEKSCEKGVKRVNDMLASHGGCDISYLKGKLFFKDGRLCLIAAEEG